MSSYYDIPVEVEGFPEEEPPTARHATLPPSAGMEHIGYIVPMEAGPMVSCDNCCKRIPGGGKHLFRADLHGYRQSCHLCGNLINKGTDVELYDSPLAIDERPTLIPIECPVGA